LNLDQTLTFHTDIAEPDPEGGKLRYREVDLAQLVGVARYEAVWGLLVDNAADPGLPPAEPFPLPVRTGDVRVDIQSALAQLAPVWAFRPLLDISDEQARDDLARACVMMLSFVAQSARGEDLPAVPQREIDRAPSIVEKFLTRWRGEVDPRAARALDAYWIAIAEHGLAPSTLTARVIASTGADVAACLSGAVATISGPLHGGAQARVLGLLDRAEILDSPRAAVREVLDADQRLMGFGHRVYRAIDPRAEILKNVCRELEAPRYDIAVDVEKTALTELAEHSPHRVLATNVDYWAAVLLDILDVPRAMFTPLFACGRSAGWAGHTMEQKHGRFIRPRAHYTGPAPRHMEP